MPMAAPYQQVVSANYTHAGLLGLGTEVLHHCDPPLQKVTHRRQAPTAEMAATPPSIRKSAPTTYAESSDAR